jgi:Na+-driven multidrug efflux pump
MRPAITHKDAALFFLPLIFMSELMMVSHSVIHAFLARLPDPKIALAAFSISFSIQTMMAGFVAVLSLAAISYASARQTFHRLLRFGWGATLFTSGITLAIALTPLGDLVYGTLLGAGAEVTRQAREASLVFAFILPVVVVRQVSNGLIMANRKTMLITLAAGVRLGSLAVLLSVTPQLLPRAAAGAVALLLCIAIETCFVVAVTSPFYRALPKQGGERASYPEIWRFAWPLMLNQMGENGLALTINFFLGRLLRADLALAAFGVVRGLVMLLASPLRNLAQTAQALVKSPEEARIILRFAGVVVGVFTLIVFLLFYTPMRTVVLERVMGLTGELADYIAPAMMAALAVPMLWGFAAVFRGLIIARRRTRRLAASAGARLAAVTLVASLTLWAPEINGAVVGVCALMGAFGTEGLLLGSWLYAAGRAGPPPAEGAPNAGLTTATRAEHRG